MLRELLVNNFLQDQASRHEKEILDAAKKSLTKLSADLQENYAKAFDPNYVPAWYESKELFEKVKKPAAEKLNSFASIKNFNLIDLVRFINEFNQAKNLNSAQDPLQCTDFFKRKKEHGNLGSILGRVSAEVISLTNSLSMFIKNRLSEVKGFIQLYHSLIAIIEENEIYADLLSADDKIRSYFLDKLTSYSNDLKDQGEDELAVGIKNFLNLDAKAQAACLPYLKQHLAFYENKRLQLNYLKFVSDTSQDNTFLQQPQEQQVKFLLGREIIDEFIEQLYFAEKKLFWHWLCRSIKSNLNRESWHENRRSSSLTQLRNNSNSANSVIHSGVSTTDESNAFYRAIHPIKMLRNQDLIAEFQEILAALKMVTLKEIKELMTKHIWEDKFPDLSAHINKNEVRASLYAEFETNCTWECLLNEQARINLYEPLAALEDPSQLKELASEVAEKIYKFKRSLELTIAEIPEMEVAETSEAEVLETAEKHATVGL